MKFIIEVDDWDLNDRELAREGLSLLLNSLCQGEVKVSIDRMED